MTRTPYAEFDGSKIHIRNIRNCSYLTADDFTLTYYDRTIELADVQTVDFIVVPFEDMPNLAHTMLSFGTRDRKYLVLSVEIRREQGEEYAAWKGSARQYELAYVLGDERDLIRLRTNFREEQVYLYPGKAEPEKVQALLVDVLRRANKLRDDPEFYDTITNNCTTNLVRHINTLSPNRVPYSYQVLLPAHSGKFAYDLGLLDSSLPFEQLKGAAHINELAIAHADDQNFSEKIRSNVLRYASDRRYFR